MLCKRQAAPGWHVPIAAKAGRGERRAPYCPFARIEAPRRARVQLHSKVFAGPGPPATALCMQPAHRASREVRSAI